MSRLPGSEKLLADLRIERRKVEQQAALLRKQIRDCSTELEHIEARLRDIDHAEGYLT